MKTAHDIDKQIQELESLKFKLHNEFFREFDETKDLKIARFIDQYASS